MSRATRDSEGQQHPHQVYLWIWLLLFVLSTFSYMVDYFHLQGMLRWTLIIVFMLLKAGFIVAIFMHMAWERLALKFAILLPPLCLARSRGFDVGRSRSHIPVAAAVLPLVARAAQPRGLPAEPLSQGSPEPAPAGSRILGRARGASVRRTRALWREYYALTKPRVVALMVFTALVGMFLATQANVPWRVLLFGSLGIALVAGAAARSIIWSTGASTR